MSINRFDIKSSKKNIKNFKKTVNNFLQVHIYSMNYR